MDVKTLLDARVSGLWRALRFALAGLSRCRPVFEAGMIVASIAIRMRFALLFAIGAIVALYTAQGREILANSFRTPWQGLVFSCACVLAAFSVWYSSRFLFETWSPLQSAAATAGGYAACLRRWLPRLIGGLVIAIPGAMVGSVAELLGDPTSALFASTILLATSLSFVLAVSALERKSSPQSDKDAARGTHNAAAKLATLDPAMRLFLSGMLVLNLAMLILVAIWPLLPSAVGLGAGVFVMIGTALVIVTGSLIVYLGDEARVPILSVLIGMAVLFSWWNDNHTVQLVDVKKTLPPVPTLSEYLDTRLRAKVDTSCAGILSPASSDGICVARVPVVIVAAEGGGVRAAAWTAQVLSGLDAELAKRQGAGAFPRALIGISGVSGGSLGAALYVAAIREGEEPGPRTKRFLQKDLMSPMLTNMLFVDNAMRFLPIAIPNDWIHDRGRTFEVTLEDAWATTRSLPPEASNLFAEPFDALWQDTELPILLANTTVVANGARMVQAPVLLNDAGTGRAFATAIDARLACWGKRMVRLSGAVHNSARFTWVSPAGRFGDDSTCSGLRVVDGGYFENSGTASAVDLIDALFSRYGSSVKPIVVQIRNDPIDVSMALPPCTYHEDRDIEARPPSASSGPQGLMNELTDPAHALLNGRTARAEQAKTNLRRRLCEGEWYGTHVEFALFRNEKVDFPLHWSIAIHSLDEMSSQFQNDALPNRRALEALIAALESPGAMPITATSSAATPVMKSPVPAAVLTAMPEKPAVTVMTREQRISTTREIMAFSDSLRQLTIAVLGGTVLLVVGSSLRRPKSMRQRLGFLWLVPAWALLVSSIHQSFAVSQRHLAVIASSKSDPVRAAIEINDAVKAQIDQAMMAMALIGVWLVSYVLWWVFHREKEENE